MTVELISVGTEILLGNIVNTNAAYLSEKCALLGLSLYYQTAVGDNEERLSETVKQAIKRSDVVILSGGLGPTEDDLTKEVAAAALGLELKEDAHTKKRIQSYFKQRNLGDITENNWKQAMIPDGAIVVDNHNGTAPGIIMEAEGKRVILLPGPPNELIPMFESDIYPYLKKLEPETICSKMVKICGRGESSVETEIRDLIDSQTNPTVAPYAKDGEVHLRVTAKAESEKKANKLIKPVVKELKSRFGKDVFTTDEHEMLEDVVVKLLKNIGLTMSTAESCSGGLLAARIINVPGASEVFEQGMVTYSNNAKRRLLGVKKGTLKKHGAVSPETAKEMAKGGAKAAKADVCVGITGIAGPGGGTKKKPVGLVYIACCIKGKVTVKEYHFTGHRAKIRYNTVISALTLLRECLLKTKKK